MTVLRCATNRVHERLLRTAPEYREARERSENAAWSAARARPTRQVGATEIPVVVHVVANTPEQEISAEQVRSQIDVLTADYRARNSDVGRVPEPFAPLIADTLIQFRLAATDPDGNPTEASPAPGPRCPCSPTTTWSSRPPPAAPTRGVPVS